MELAERLIIALDPDPVKHGSTEACKREVLSFADSVAETGVVIKLNSVLRAVGYSLIGDVHERDLSVFADLKLVDIPNTMKNDAAFLAPYAPEMLTVMCSAGIAGMHAVQSALPDTNVLGVTVLTSLDEEECQQIFACSTRAGVLRFGRMAQLASLGNLVLSPNEVEVVKKRPELALSCNTPGIRPLWSLVSGDDQSRVMTPGDAIAAGAERIVVGRPITQHEDPREAIERTLEEIQQGLDRRAQVNA